MKICEYIPSASFFVGGGEIYPLMQATFLAKLGHKVDVVALKSDTVSPYFEEYIKNASVNIIYLKSPLQKKEQFDKKVFDHRAAHKLYYSLSRRFTDLCLDKKYDIVISHYGPAVISVTSSIKQILILHGVPSERQKINKIALNLADILISDSLSIADGWKKMFSSKRKIWIIGNAVDSKNFYPVKTKKDIDLLYLGRLIRIKGVQDLIRAVKLITRNTQNKIKIVIAGKGPYEPELRKLVYKLNLESEIKFLDYIKEEDKNELYNRAKITVFPSYAKEGVLTTVLEAASTESAIITTNCCGMVDFIRPNKNGLLFEPRNIHELADAINELIANPDKRKRVGKNARKDILKNWTWDVNAKKIENLVKKYEQK